MKQNVKNKKQQKVYIRRRIALVCILILLAVILILNINSKKGINRIATGENALNIGGENLDLSKVVGEANPPTVGAGMIPIKWDENQGMWVITTKDDPDWYNYSEGKWATVMLSDGKYSSEPERGKILAQVGVGVPDDPNKRGTIFTWIPRLAYLEDNIEYLQGTSVVEYQYKTEECFNLKYGVNNIDLAVTGFWVGQKEYSNIQEVENKNAEMNAEENTQGLMANEQVTSLTQSDKTAIQKLYEKTVENDALVVPNALQNPDTMNFRQVIKIVNTNNKIPIIPTHEIEGDYIKILAKYSKYGISFITDKDGNRLTSNKIKIDEENTSYTFYLVDTQGNVKKYNMSYGSGKPNLKGFNLSNTFYVMYDELGNETSQIPAGETAPEDWYNYENQRWANIVVRDNGCETYYTWIPRYMYKLNLDGSETVDAKLVDLNNVWTDTENEDKQVDLKNTDYVLPEAFTWENPNDPNEKIQLSGFWTSKFKLGESVTTIPNIVGGMETITVRDITQATEKNTTTGENKYICELYLIKDGKRIKWNDGESCYKENTEAIILEETNYTFEGLEKGKYTVNIIIKDKETNLQVGAITKQVKVIDDSSINKPNIDKFDKEHTYYVVYDDEGKEDSSIRLTEPIPSNWYNYCDRKWANIVVRINENETYYTWIPRYEYALNAEEERTNVNFIPTEQIEADTGYKIPEAFTWENPNNADEKIQLDGFWTSKFKLGEGIDNPSDNIYGTGNAIKVTTSIVNNDSSYDYFIYAFSKEKNEDGTSKYKYYKQITSIDNTLDGDGSGVVAGEYIVNVIKKDKQGNHIQGISRDVTVIESQKAYPPELDKYNPNITYYAEYNKEGATIINTNQTLNMKKPDKWYNYDDLSNLAENPIVEATIVVREKDYDTYYKWIPRYEYSLSDDITHRTYISTNKTEADDGYTIPDKFTDAEGNAITGYWEQTKRIRNEISANIVTTDNEIKITQIVLPKNTTGKIKLTSESQVVGEYDLTDIQGDSHTYSNLDNTKKYEISIFAYNSDGTIASIFVLEERLFKVELNMETQNFNKSNTFYVVYDENGNESSSIPIGEDTPENWYDYTNRRWANVVVRDNGCETYFTWIPRYEYKLQPEIQKTDVIFISKEQTEADWGYQIPEAFTWENPDNADEKIQLDGFWTSKFKLGNGQAGVLKIDGGYGEITVKNITQATETTTITGTDGATTTKNKYVCEMYLIKDGKRTNTQPIILTEENYTFSGLTEGNYTVNIIVKNNDEEKLQVGAITKQVSVTGDNFVNAPNLDGFDKAHTYYVVYDEFGYETSDTLITKSAPKGWYNYEGRQWANIVVRQNGSETYYTWIPRYGYAIDAGEEKTYVKFIYGTGDAPQGYTLPEAFTWEDPNDSSKKIQLEGFWISKFKLSEGATSSGITFTEEGTIDMKNVITTSNYTYHAYLYSNDRATKGNKINEIQGITTEAKDSATFKVSTDKNYVVTVFAKDANGNYVSAISQDITYITEDEITTLIVESVSGLLTKLQQ